VAGARPRIPLGDLTALPHAGCNRRVEEKGLEGRGGEERGEEDRREGHGRGGRGGKRGGGEKEWAPPLFWSSLRP